MAIVASETYLDKVFLENCCPGVIEATKPMCDRLRTRPAPAP
jgi:hypothetical protein